MTVHTAPTISVGGTLTSVPFNGGGPFVVLSSEVGITAATAAATSPARLSTSAAGS